MNNARRPQEAIIFAGGKGTRLHSVSGDIPKPLMPVGGRPFLEHLLTQLDRAGVSRAVLALGYCPDAFTAQLGTRFHDIELIYSIEQSPLGTGGALALALHRTEQDSILVMNGDSYFNIDVADFFAYHVSRNNDVTVALAYRENCSRYGSVSFSSDRIIGYREKGISGSGHINGGMYIVNRRIATLIPENRFFSFEVDLLGRQIHQLTIAPYVSDGYFIDIGIPEDYLKAQQECVSIMRVER